MRMIDGDDLRAMAAAAARRTDDELRFEARVEQLTLFAIFALAFGFLAWCGYSAYRAPVEERAAYNESRYGVDRETALYMAERGIGKTLAELAEGK